MSGLGGESNTHSAVSEATWRRTDKRTYRIRSVSTLSRERKHGDGVYEEPTSRQEGG